MAILCAHFYPLLKFREHSSEVYCCDHFGFLPVLEDGKENALDSSPEIRVMPSLTPSRTHTHICFTAQELPKNIHFTTKFNQKSSISSH